MEFKDYYKILGIDKNASDAEIKRAYRDLAKKYHPDLHPNDKNAQAKFQEINEAYQVLGDKEKRKQYDMFGSNYNFAGGQHFDPSQYGFGNAHTYTYTGSGKEGFSDFFNMFFGQGAQGFNLNDLFSGAKSAGFRSRSKPLESELNLTIKEAYEGVTKDISLNIDGERKNIRVKIPKGILPGKRLRVRGKKWGINRDILFKINFIEDDLFKIEGLDITSTINILPWEAALGSKVVINTLEGKIRLTIPKGITGGSKIRIPNKGYVDMDKKRGDLYVKLNIVNPPNLSKEEIKMYEELSRLSTYNPRRE